MSKTWVLVEWREEPPTYDIVPKKDILKKKFEPGDVVDVAYEDESSPATIIDIDGKKYCKQQDSVMTEDKYFLLEYFCPFREQRNPQEEVQARGEKKKTAMCAKCRKKSGKEK